MRNSNLHIGRKNVILVMAMVLLLSHLISAAGNFERAHLARGKVSQADIWGSWKVKRYVSGTVSAMSAKEAQKIIGRSISLSAQEAYMLKDSCMSIDMERRMEQTDDHLHTMYRTDKKKLGITADSLEVITIFCKGNYFSELLFADDQLIYTYKGVFFFMERE